MKFVGELCSDQTLQMLVMMLRDHMVGGGGWSSGDSGGDSCGVVMPGG